MKEDPIKILQVPLYNNDEIEYINELKIIYEHKTSSKLIRFLLFNKNDE